MIYNVIRDYDAAAQAFHDALKVRPDDYQLWNKLGAVSIWPVGDVIVLSVPNLTSIFSLFFFFFSDFG